MQSAYAVAIDAARDTLVIRARQYKWLVVLVSLGGLATLLVAVVLQSWWVLLAWSGLPAIVTAFFALDMRAVQRWRAHVLAAWRSDDLQIDLLGSTLQKVPTLPASTVVGMLETLPTWPGSSVPLPSRPALLRAQALLADCALQDMLLRSVAWALVAAAVAMAVSSAAWAWLALAASGPLLWWAWCLACHWRVRRLCADASWRAALAPPAIMPGEARSWLAGLNFQGVPRSLVNTLPAMQAAVDLP